GSDARLWTTLSPLGAQAPAAFCVQAATNAHAFLITLYDNGFTRSEISGAFRAENCEQNLQDAAYRRDGRCVGAGPGRLRQYGVGFPYRPNIQQGNWITAEQVERLEPGMTREQVRFLLGTPTLQDIFRSDRWDYPYYSKPGYGEPEQRRFSVWFEGDSLVRWEGDAQPDRQPFQRTDTGAPEATKDTRSSATES